jgi:hypothetical protein
VLPSGFFSPFSNSQAVQSFQDLYARTSVSTYAGAFPEFASRISNQAGSNSLCVRSIVSPRAHRKDF